MFDQTGANVTLRLLRESLCAHARTVTKTVREDAIMIRAIALQTTGVSRVHALRTRHIGSGWQVDLHILVNGSITVREGHIISEAVKQRLLAERPDIVDVLVHLEPEEDADDQ